MHRQQAPKKAQISVHASRHLLLASVVAGLMAACGKDEPGEAEAKDTILDGIGCEPPTGTFQVETIPTIVMLGTRTCELEDVFESVLIYDGTVDSLIDPGCTGSARRAMSTACIFEVREQCDGIEIEFALTLLESGEVRGKQHADDGNCSVSYSLVYTKLVPEKP